MSKLNKYSQRQSVRSNFVPKEFGINVGLYKGLLDNEQKTYNKLQAIGDIPIEALEGSDTLYAQKLRKSLYDDIDKVSKSYKEKGVSSGKRGTRDLLRSIKRRVLPGGDIYELKARKQKFGKFLGEQQKRLEKGDIDQFQFNQSVSAAKKQYDADGGYGNKAKLNLSSRTNAVNFDKFAQDFVKNYKDTELLNQSGMKIVNGRFVYDEQKVKGVEGQRVMNELKAAYRNAASATGQLEDRFNTQNSDGSQYKSYTDGFTKDEQKAKDLQAVIASGNTRDIQKALNNNGFKLKVDGKKGKATKRAIEKANKAIELSVGSLDGLSDLDKLSLVQDQYTDDYLNQLVKPYASATARANSSRKFTQFGKTLDRVRAEKDEEGDLKPLIVDALPKNKGVGKDMEFYIDRKGTLRKNTNKSADLKRDKAAFIKQFGHLPNVGYGSFIWNKTASMLDKMFTNDDKADIDSSVQLSNVKEHLTSRGVIKSDTPEAEVTRQVAKEVSRQSNASVSGVFNANMKSKIKKNYDSIFFDGKFDGESTYNTGIMKNFSYVDGNGKKISGQNLAKQLESEFKGEKISFNGVVDDWTQPYEYGTAVLSIGNKEIYQLPSVSAKNDIKTFANGLWRSKINSQVGNVIDFEYKGRAFQSVYKPDGTYQVRDLTNNKVVDYVENEVDGQLDMNNPFIKK